MNLPTHHATGHFKDKGFQVRTGKIKFHCPAGGDPQKHGEETIAKYLSDPKPRPGIVMERVDVKPLAPPKLGAKLNKQHDYVTLRATFPDGVLSMTSSWGGFKITGDFVSRPETRAIFQATQTWERKTKRNVAQKMDDLLILAQASKTYPEFCEKLQKKLEEPEPEKLAATTQTR